MKVRHAFLTKLRNIPYWINEAFKTVISDILEEKGYNENYKPIDSKTWEKYYEGQGETIIDEIFLDMDNVLYDLYVYAIFSDDFLAIEKIHEMIWVDSDNFFFSEANSQEDEELTIFADFVDFDEEDEEEIVEEEKLSLKDNQAQLKSYDDIVKFNLGFYLRFIKRLESLINTGNLSQEEINVLENTRIRLIYALDMPDYRLYKKENLDYLYEQSKKFKLKLKNGDFDFIENLVIFMTEEFFLKPNDKYTTRKLLFVGSYYDLTKDKRIRNILEKYKNHENYNYVKNMITKNDDLGFLRKRIK